MDRQRYQRVAPFLTVYSPRRQVDIDRAPRGVLKALGLLPSADLKHLIESRNAQTDDLATSYSSVFAVRAEATTQNGAHFVRVAIVRRTANPATPFEILEWRRDWSGGQDSR
jgi:type II secretory pathway component PulK